jgi:HAMP domain-containing protein/HPt (histidine-containing phosphotransfer) domain-containing protein
MAAASSSMAKPSASLRRKFVRTLLFVASLIGLSTLGIVVWTSAQTSAQHLGAIRGYIEEGIASKGAVLTTNHALALRSLSLDNAFLDMQRLVERAVKDDEDVVYGVFVNSDRTTLALSRAGSGHGTEPLRSDAWTDLGLHSDELLVDKLTTKHVVRAGHDLLEIAAPIVSEEGERLGTIRYGLSTRRMQQALASAKRDSDARLWRSVAFIGALVSAATLLGLLLSRAQAVRITRPVSDLTRAAEELATGRRSVRVQVDSGDELELLGASFNRMVEQLDASYKELQEMNRTLEHKVTARTAELALKNRDLELVLDNVDQGFITLSPQGVVCGQPSRIVSTWFGDRYAGVPLADYVGKVAESFGAKFRLAWAQVEEDVLPLEVSLDQLPSRLEGADRTWSVRYLPFRRNGSLEGVLVVVDDITERLAHEREEAQQTELMHAFRKFMTDRTGFMAFMSDATTMVKKVGMGAVEPEQLVSFKRMLHTIKGNAGVMGLPMVARLCHTLEDQLAEAGETSETTVRELTGHWNAIRRHVQQFVDETRQPFVELSEPEYASLVSYLSGSDGQAEMLRQVLTWRLEPAARSLERLAEQAKALAERLGKGDVDVEVRASRVRLDPRTWMPFYSDLVHLVRNAIDHGLETPEERREAGKPVNAKLVLRAEMTAESLLFEVSDDGRGIDWQRIAEKARKQGLPHRTPADLTLALYADGISTADEVTDISGRGVGMAAFKNRVDALHGTVEVRSAKNAGTSWLIRFPVATAAAPAVSAA